MSTQRQRARIPQATVREQFIAKGCDGKFLDELRTDFRQHYRTNDEIPKAKKELDALLSRLTKIASDIEEVRARPLTILSGKSLAEANLLPPSLLPPSLLRSEAKNLKEARSKIERLAVRTDLRATAIKKIYRYCSDATREYFDEQDRLRDLQQEQAGKQSLRKKRSGITHQHIADLLCEWTKDIPNEPIISENAVTKALKRQRLPANEEWHYAHNLAGEAMRGDKVWDFTRRKLRSRDADKT